MAKPDLNVVGGALRAIGYKGQKSRLSENITDSAINENATVITFGEAVAKGTTDKTCKIPTTSSEKLLGLVERDVVTHVADSTGEAGFAQYKDVPIMKLGYMNAMPVENVSKGDQVVVLTSGGNYVGLGGTTVAVPGSGRQILPGHVWETTTAANVLGEISRLPGNLTAY